MNLVEERIKQSFSPIELSTDLASIRASARRRRYVRGVSLVTSIVALALVVGIVVPALLPAGHEPSAAADTLRQLSEVAAKQPAVTVGPDQYVYSKIQARWETCEGNDCVLQQAVQELWIAPDGSGRMAGSRGSNSYSEVLGRGEFNSDDLTKVPTDVDALRSFIRERASKADQPLDYEMFVVVGDLLRESFSSPVLYESPQLRSALFEVASTLPGVELIGDTTDGIGRPGIAVGYTEGGIRHELIFDPDTSAILGDRDVSVRSGGTVPGSWSAYVESGVVSSTNAHP